jgi:gliding motility-associated-like protein
VNAGPDQTLNCSTPCATLTATPFNAGATTSYSVGSIPHNPPIPYNQAGTGVSVGTDDIWSPIINLPFNFCFYGVNYSQILVGANGNLSFNTANAGQYCPWPFTATCPSAALAPAGNIFGIYHDIDPSVCGNIKWNLVGTAPCRIFVVSYDQICQFSCTNITSRHMIVLYETTNVIDVYVQSKPTCSGWNSGNAVIGIQNPAGNAGITPPARNTGAWTVNTPEAWRFLPNGAPIYTIDWLEGTNVIGTTPSLSVCPSVATTYTARATYTRCDGTTVVEEDQVLVSPANTGLVLSQNTNTPASCGLSNGGFSVAASGGTPGYTYSLDNITYQPGTSFTGLSVGAYTAYVQDAAGCISTLNVSIQDNSTLALSIGSVQNVLCNGGSSGSIVGSASGGTTPYSFTINGTSNGASGSFSNLAAGNYTIVVTDNNGCVESIDTTVTEPLALNLTEIGTNNTTCNLANGSLEVSGAGGISPLTYSIDNGATSQPTGIFNAVAATNFTVLLTDGNGCTTTIPVTVGADAFPIITVANSTNVSCFGAMDGTTDVTASSGLPPYLYSVNGQAPQSTPNFSSLSAGNYTFTLVDANGCVATVNNSITEPTLLNASSSMDTTLCVGMSTVLSGVASGGTQPYSYLWTDGTTTSTENVSPTVSTAYTLTITDGNGCVSNATTNVTIVPIPDALGQHLDSTGNSPLTIVFDNLSTNATEYLWDFGNGETNPTSTNASQTVIYNEPGTYAVVLTASNGICDDTWTTFITVIPMAPLEVYVPNVFSPNSDDANDFYFISTKNAKTLEAVIIDRWGLVMIEFDNITDKWDGKVKGKDAVEGTYFVKYTVTGLDATIQEGHTFFQLVR